MNRQKKWNYSSDSPGDRRCNRMKSSERWSEYTYRKKENLCLCLNQQPTAENKNIQYIWRMSVMKPVKKVTNDTELMAETKRDWINANPWTNKFTISVFVMVFRWQIIIRRNKEMILCYDDVSNSCNIRTDTTVQSHSKLRRAKSSSKWIIIIINNNWFRSNDLLFLDSKFILHFILVQQSN